MPAAHLWNYSDNPPTCARCNRRSTRNRPTPTRECAHPLCPPEILDPSDHHPECAHFHGAPCRRESAIIESRLDLPQVQLHNGDNPVPCRNCNFLIETGQPVFSDLSSDYETPYCSETCLLIDSVQTAAHRQGFHAGLADAGQRLTALITGAHPIHNNSHRHCTVCNSAIHNDRSDICDNCRLTRRG